MLTYVQAQKQLVELKKTGKWSNVPSDLVIEKTVNALSQNGFEVEVVDSREEARKRVLDLVPEGSEVMTMTSKTLEAIDVVKIFNESGKYNSVRAKLMQMDRATQSLEMQKLGAAPEYALGSVHAVTEDGHVLVASATGSQLSGYAYASAHVIWVVGAQKIVENIDEGFKRINERSLPMEAVRMHEANGAEGSTVRKVLVVNSEFKLGRIKIILVTEELGF